MLARSQPLPATRALQGRQWLRASSAVTRPQPRLSASASRRYVAPSAALQGAEVFVHPRYGRAVRATERLPAGAVVLKERPFFTTRTSAKAAAEAAKAAATLQCEQSVPARILAFCAAPEDVRARVLQVYDGGGPSAWPKAPADSDVHPDKDFHSADNTASVALKVAAWLVEHCADARGFTAEMLARVAVIVALNGHSMANPSDENREESVTALFELSSKFAHSCDPNAEYDWDDGVLTHKTLCAVAPGEVVTVDYYSGVWAGCGAVSTAVRRHRLVRGKFFLCHCTLCSAPDALAALPCPACTTREGDGTLPLGRIFDSQADAEDWEHPMFIKMRDHPVVIPDGDDAAEAAAAAPSWRCTSCGGVFSRDSMARLIIAAGVRRPLPRSEMLSARYSPASLLDVARWAESNSVAAEIQINRLVSNGSPDVIFAPGGIAEVNLGRLNTLINEFAAIVGTSHASVTLLRLFRLKVALRGTFSHINDPSKKPSRAQMAAIVRRLLTVRSSSAAAAIPASALLAAEVEALAAILRRGKRMFAMFTLRKLLHFACVMDSLGGLDDPSMARLVLDLLRELEKSKYAARDSKKAQALAMMQRMVLSHAPFWTRGGDGCSSAA